jgi:hypothetical protein
VGTLRIQFRKRRKKGEHGRRKLNVDLLKETGKKIIYYSYKKQA